MTVQTVSFLKRLPNILTMLRFFAVPVFVILLIDPTPVKNLWAVCIFVIAAFTDWLDGYIARMYHAESIVGTLLDPLADKVLVMAALVMLCAVPIEPRVPAWMVVILLSREMIITGLRSLAALQGRVVPASGGGKHKTAWMMVSVIFLLIEEPYVIFGTLVNFHVCGMTFLWIALAFSLWSGVDYAIKLRSLFYESANTSTT